MQNLLAISLTPLFKKQLKTISKAAIPNFSRVWIRSTGVTLQRKLFKRKHRIDLHDFLTETLPKELNRWAESKDIESPLPYFGNSVEFLLHLDAIGERNIISYLWKCYTHVIILMKDEKHKFIYIDSTTGRNTSRPYVNTRVTTNVIETKVLRDFKHMRNNVSRTIKVIGIHNPIFDVVYQSPDIRGSPRIRTNLARAG